MDTAPGDDSAQSDQGAGPSLPPPPCPGEGGGAAESCWARGEPEHQSIRIGRDSVLFGKSIYSLVPLECSVHGCMV